MAVREVEGNKVICDYFIEELPYQEVHNMELLTKVSENYHRAYQRAGNLIERISKELNTNSFNESDLRERLQSISVLVNQFYDKKKTTLYL